MKRTLGLLIGLGLALVGIALVAYGLTLRIVDGPGLPYPNHQHASTYPTPRR